MSTSMPKPHIIAVGIPLSMGPQGPIKVPWSDTPISIPEEVAKATKAMQERGYDETFELLEIRPDEINKLLTEKLKSKKWDALVVGGGFKTVPELTEALEELLNTAKDVSPETRIMFVSKGPMSLIEAVERYEKIHSSRGG